MNSNQLIDTLAREVQQQIDACKELATLPATSLNHKISPESWSALECIAHLNSYSAHYLPAFEKAMLQSASRGYTHAPEFHSTWLGRYCIKTILPQNIHKKISSPKQHNPSSSDMGTGVLEKFQANQQRLLALLANARQTDLNRTKVNIEIMQWLKLRLGDFLQFFIYHQSRHLLQAKRVVETAR